MPAPPRKGSPIEPIMLWGFCFSTQAKQTFNTPWGAAWLTNQYTDERHEMWEHIGRDDLSKKREIKYGNNIAVLFGALLECKAFFGQEGFWHAISRGFNTNSTILRCTAEILTDARRIQRGKPAKEISDTARAADRWIAFLDSDAARLKHRGEPSDSSLSRMADSYFKRQERSWVNAAWVPIGQPRDQGSHANRPPSPPRVKSEPGVDTHELLARPPPVRKRSPSRAPFDTRSPKIRRTSHVSGTGESVPPTGPRSFHREFDFPVHKPDPDYHRQDSRDWEKDLERDKPRDPPLSSRDDRSLRLGPPNHINGDRDRDHAARTERDDLLHKDLQGRIASLEKELAQTKAKLTVTATATTKDTTSESTTTTENGSSNQLGTQMNSVTVAVSTMMESMHDIVDSLTRLQEEVTSLSMKQQPGPAQPQIISNDFDKMSKVVVEPLSTISESIKSLQTQVSELKESQTKQQQPPGGAVSSDDLHSLTELVKTLFKQQSDQLKSQSEQIAALNQNMIRLQQRQQQQSASPAPGHGGGTKQVPQTLQQAIHNAERDLWHHYSSVSDFYHKLDINKTSRATTERTAEFLAMLQHSVDSAKAMGGSPGL